MEGTVILIVLGALGTAITIGVSVAFSLISVPTLLLGAAGFSVVVAVIVITT